MDQNIIKKLLILVCLCMSEPGCVYWLVESHPRYQYVLDIGSPKRIGCWMLSQSDFWKLYDGFDALRDIMITTHDAKTAREAMDAYVAVFRIIQNWPPDEVLPTRQGEEHKQITVQGLLSGQFYATASAAYDFPLAKDLLYEIRPDDNHQELQSAWNGSVAHLKKELQIKQRVADKGA